MKDGSNHAKYNGEKACRTQDRQTDRQTDRQRVRVRVRVGVRVKVYKGEREDSPTFASSASFVFLCFLSQDERLGLGLGFGFGFS